MGLTALPESLVDKINRLHHGEVELNGVFLTVDVMDLVMRGV